MAMVLKLGVWLGTMLKLLIRKSILVLEIFKLLSSLRLFQITE